METMDRYTIYCTDMQIIRARELGAPIYVDKNGKIKLPTTQQMRGWLREKGIYIGVTNYRRYLKYFASVYYDGAIRYSTRDYSTWEQAEVAAIDVALDYLEEGDIL